MGSPTWPPGQKLDAAAQPPTLPRSLDPLKPAVALNLGGRAQPLGRPLGDMAASVETERLQVGMPAPMLESLKQAVGYPGDRGWRRGRGDGRRGAPGDPG